MKYLSVCSGIEAATVAWHPLGWSPVAFSEIEKHPSAVLAHHYGSNMPGKPLASNGVPNLGDMTKFEEWPDYAIDLLVGGTPCQSFSIAGLRKGLDDPRGNLMLTYLAIARRYQPHWVVWENVPGVLSSNKGRDFAAFIQGLAECGYHAAWRVLDAQYVRVDGYPRAVPQRRRRVFVVGYLGDWRYPAAVLFEPEGMRGDIAPSRKAGKGFARDVAPSLRAQSNCSLRDDSEAYVATFDRQSSGEYGTAPIASTVSARDYESPSDLVALAFDCKASGQSGFGVGAIASTLRAMGHKDSHTNGGGHQAVCITSDVADVAGTLCKDSFSGGAGGRPEGAAAGHFVPVQVVAPLNTQMGLRGADTSNTNREGVGIGNIGDPSFTLQAAHSHGIISTSAVRRLTPLECERLQGFPDNYTKIPWGTKPDSPDGPRYKELGNSMAVNCMRWIGRRIQMVEELTSKEAAE